MSDANRITIRHDLIWGYYANVTPDQTEKIGHWFVATDEDLFLNEKTAARLHSPGLDFLVFPEQHRAELLRSFAEPHCTLGIEREITETPSPYHPPVLQLFTLGKSKHHARETPPDYYQQLGITHADIPELTRLFTDPEIQFNEGCDYSPTFTARQHAQRALAELRAPAATRLFLEDFHSAGDDALLFILPSESLQIIPSLGDDAYDTILAMLDEYPADTVFRMTMYSVLGDTAKISVPARREHCIEILKHQLENHPVNAPHHNALLIAALCDLKATETAPLIEQAYADDHVELEYYGDWEDAQIGLGLKTKRDHLRKPLWRDNPFHNHPILNTEYKAGRNDPCPCGSGKKYKKCCMDKKS